MTNRWMLAIVTGGTLFIASCTSAERANTERLRSVSAQTEAVEARSITDYIQAPGTVHAQIQTVVSSKAMGRIISVAAHEGDRVRQGEILVEIEGQDVAAQLRRAEAGQVEADRSLDEAEGAIRAAQAAVHTAEANEDLALATRKRYEILRDRHSISPQEFDEVDSRHKTAQSQTEGAKENLKAAQARRLQAMARIEQAKAEVEATKVALGYLKIGSPINGLVTARQADPGMLATPGTPLITIEDDRTYQLHVMIEEAGVGNIRIGEHVTVQIDGRNEPLDSRVQEIVPASDPSTRTYTVKLSLPNEPEVPGRFHSGFFGRALIPAGTRQALVIPESALVHRGQLTGVYVVQNHSALLRLVKTGKRYDGGIEVLSGLDSGVRIVNKPGVDIADGVTIVDTDGANP